MSTVSKARMDEYTAYSQATLCDIREYPSKATKFPRLRYMGSKYRLLPWLHGVLAEMDFSSALDVFSGSGCVGYLMKCMGKRVITNDFLDFANNIGLATVANPRYRLSDRYCQILLKNNRSRGDFIQRTFSDVFFTREDLRFLDNAWANMPKLPNRYHRALAIAALVRSCVKRQPRGVFTVAGDPNRYDDGRRDLRLTLQEHFLESAKAYNEVVFDNGQPNEAMREDVFALDSPPVDLVYMDPPYVPRADDNCYIKRYHFLEGLASYWQGPGTEIVESTKVKKIPKRFTPFSYRRTAVDAFDRMFAKFRQSILVLSYSSNGYPDLDALVRIMGKYKCDIQVFERNHQYHFGTHDNVAKTRTAVREFLVVGE